MIISHLGNLSATHRTICSTRSGTHQCLRHVEWTCVTRRPFFVVCTCNLILVLRIAMPSHTSRGSNFNRVSLQLVVSHNTHSTITMHPRLFSFTTRLNSAASLLKTGHVKSNAPFICRTCRKNFSTSPSLRLFGKAKEAVKEKERRTSNRSFRCIRADWCYRVQVQVTHLRCW